MRGKLEKLFLIVFFLTLGFSQAWGYSGWETYIPNGNVYSCDNCHLPDSSARTQFGVDFKNNNKTWSSTLADLDSDDDGYTNGDELQDPNGTWVKGQPQPGNSALVSNPGDVTSIPGETETYLISGNVRGRAAAAGIIITMTGPVSDTTVTDANGNYTFSGLPDGNYTLTPSKTGYKFLPKQQEVTINSDDITDVNFFAFKARKG